MLIKNTILYLFLFSLIVGIVIEVKTSFAQLGIDEDIPIQPQNNTSPPPSPSPPPSLPLDPLLK